VLDWVCRVFIDGFYDTHSVVTLLTGVTALKKRVQHPTVHEWKDRGRFYWFFRYRHDEVLPDGSIKTTRKFHTIGPSRGEGAMSRKEASVVRDDFLAGLKLN